MSEFGNIGDFLPQTEVECRVRGCHNRVKISANVAMQNIVNGKSPRPARLCDECFAKLQTLQDQELPCSKPGCTGTWIWSRFQQLEAIVSGHPDRKPRGFCDKCREEMKAIQEEQHPCRIKGCKNTWTLTAREKLALNGKPIPQRLCNDCYAKLQTLRDREVPCRIKGCSKSWVWSRYQQLEHLVAGKSLDNPPARMCPDCARIYSMLTVKEIPCRIKGCKHTWSWPPFEQLEAILAKQKENPQPEGTEQAQEQKPIEPTPPARMCKDCFTFWNAAKDIERPCKNPACKNTWLFTRGMQLAQRVHGYATPPVRYCEACAKRAQELAPKEMPCSTPGCTGTWTYTVDKQLRDESLHREPEPRQCHKCYEFLASNPQKEILCAKCGKPVKVSSMQQLLASLGSATMPQFCAECTRKQLSEGISAEAAKTSITRPDIYIPKSGPWLAESKLCTLPGDATDAKIAAMAAATVRIVCLGDELTVSSSDPAQKWPVLLQHALAEKFPSVQVFNAGLPGSSTAFTLLRLERDLIPFQPNLVVFSAAFADATSIRHDDEEALQKLYEDTVALIKKCTELGAKILVWTPNPVDFAQAPSNLQNVAASLDAVVKKTLRAAQDTNTPVVDVRALFAANGELTAKKWMDSWLLPNAAGANNIANWLKDQILMDSLVQEGQSLREKNQSFHEK